MSKKIFSTIISLIFTCIVSLGQQTPTFSEYNYNTFIINSAYAGFNPSTEITLSSSGFLGQFDGSPKTTNFSVSSRLKSNNVGLGLGLIVDEIGVTSSTTIFGAYSYKLFSDSQRDMAHWQAYKEHVISFSITGGVQLFKDSLLELEIDNDENFSDNVDITIPMVGFGFLWNKEHLYFGFSTPNILGNRFASDDSNIDVENVFYSHLGTRFFISNFHEFMIEPSILLKYENGAPLQVDLNTAIRYKNKFEIGAGYRTASSINFLVGFYLFNNWRLIYNYNQSTAKSLLKNTHGMILSYRLGNGFNNN